MIIYLYDCKISLKMKIFVILFLSICMLQPSQCSFSSNTFYRTVNNVVSDIYKQSTVASLINCGVLCESEGQCNSINFRAIDGTEEGDCQLSELALKDVPLHSQSSNEWNTYSKTGPSDWILMFHGISDIGTDPYEAWKDGDDITTDDVNCMTHSVTSCTKHYRRPMVDSWNKLSIKEVKYAFVENGNEVAYIIFNGTGTNILSWFDTFRVTSSSWSGLNLYNLTTQHFSIEGDPPSRRFFIVDMYSSCWNDMVLILTLYGLGHPCSYDVQTSYPRFMYSKEDSWSYWERNPASIGFADSMTISVRIY